MGCPAGGHNWTVAAAPLDGIDPLAVCEAAPDGLLVVAPDGTIRWANRAAHELLGHPPGSLAGRSVEDLVPPDLADRHRRLRAGYNRAPRSRPMGVGMDLRARRADGSEVPVEISLSPLPTDDGPVVIAAVRDVSERLSREAELALLAERERIAADLHDHTIQRLFGIGLRLQAAAPRAGAAAGTIAEAVAELDEAIREIRTTIFALHRQAPRGANLHATVVEVCREASRTLGFTPRVEVTGPVDSAATDEAADALVAALREALANVARHARARRADVRVAARQGRLTFEVADDGVGIAPGAPEGEGMRTMRWRAERLGGDVSVDSRPGAGTTVRWSVPLG